MADKIRFQYAIKPELPTAWLFAGLVDEGASVTIPPPPSGVSVWIRARRERLGFRPSAWGAPVEIVVGGANPALYSWSVRLSVDGTPEVSWSANAATAGVRLEWSIQPTLADVVYTDTIDLAVDDNPYELYGEVVNVGESVNIRLTPWTGFSGGVVSGHAGQSQTDTQHRSE